MRITIFQKKVFAFIMLISCINLFTGCHRYYRPVKVDTSTIENKRASIKSLTSANRYFILRKGSKSYALNNAVLNEDQLVLTATLDTLPKVHGLYVADTKRSYKYSKAKKQDSVLMEVHLFVSDTGQVGSMQQQYTLPLSQVERIEVIEFNKGRTTSSYLAGALGITLGVGLVVLLIAVATYKEPTPTADTGSCPYISAFNGERFALQGEIYSGAIYPSLQKEDYLQLNMKSNNGAYLVKISNDLKEIQYTDFSDLMVVEHNKDVQLLIDPQGKLHAFSKPNLPITASLNNRLNVINELKFKDYNSCNFNEGSGSNNREDLFLTFKNEEKKTNGKLVLSAKTSLWFNYVYNEFTKGFGGYYNTWVKEQEKKSAVELDRWADEQHVPLTISVKTKDGWKEVNKIKTIGPLLNRDIVIPIDINSEEIVEVKISGGYLFWELDYAAIDYSDDANISVREIKPYEAINEKGINVLPQLQWADKKYMVQANTGDSTILKYKSIEAHPGMAQSFFFHTSGYYNHPRDHKGIPKVAFVKSFAQPGALSAFSKRKFSEALNRLEIAKK